MVARTYLELRSPAAGTVGTLAVESGDEVEAGEVLLTVSSPAAEDALAAAERAAAEIGDGEVGVPESGGVADGPAAQAAADAFDDAESAAEVLPEGPARDSLLAQIASSRAAYEAAQAQAQDAVDRFQSGLGSLAEAVESLSAAGRIQAESAVTAARRTVDALTIRAPAAGVVTLGTGGGGASGGGLPEGFSERLLQDLPSGAGAAGDLLGGGAGPAAGAGTLTVGTPVSAGAVLATVIDDSELTLRAEVDETDVLAVEEGIPADVQLDAVPGAVYPATVRGVDLAPTASARGGVTYAVTLTLADGESADGGDAPRPRPGMSAVVSLRVEETEDVISVPASAIVRDRPQEAVWVVSDGELVRREITVGAEGDSHVEVRDGLDAGDRVVIRGADTVREGDDAP